MKAEEYCEFSADVLEPMEVPAGMQDGFPTRCTAARPSNKLFADMYTQ